MKKRQLANLGIVLLTLGVLLFGAGGFLAYADSSAFGSSMTYVFIGAVLFVFTGTAIIIKAQMY